MDGSSRRCAFTLVELLVVIAVIAVLVGLLLPALGAARTSARIVASGSNQKQIAVAMKSYQADHDGRYPLWQWTVAPSGDLNDVLNFTRGGGIAYFWATRFAIDGYVADLGVYRDPSWAAQTRFLDMPVERASQNDRAFNGIHYAYNYRFLGSNVARVQGYARTITPRRYICVGAIDEEIADPGGVMLTTTAIGLREMDDAPENTAGSPWGSRDLQIGAHTALDRGQNLPFAGVPHPRHKGAVQMSFADGHVESIPITRGDAFDDTTTQPEAWAIVYADDALGTPAAFGSLTGGARVGNYFDLHPSRPISR